MPVEGGLQNAFSWARQHFKENSQTEHFSNHTRTVKSDFFCQCCSDETVMMRVLNNENIKGLIPLGSPWRSVGSKKSAQQGAAIFARSAYGFPREHGKRATCLRGEALRRVNTKPRSAFVAIGPAKAGNAAGVFFQ